MTGEAAWWIREDAPLLGMEEARSGRGSGGGESVTGAVRRNRRVKEA